MNIHELKTDPDVFDAVANGDKSFEIRFDDRNFQVGDKLTLRRTKYRGEEMKAPAPHRKLLIYTGEEITARVTYILRGPRFGLSSGWVIMSIEVTNQVKSK